MAKLKVMNSTMGFSPPKAAPTARPVKPCSVIGGVDDTLGAELVEQALGDLVGALVFADLLAHQKDVVVTAHFLGHGVAQRVAHGLLPHFGAFGPVGFGLGWSRT